MERTYRRCALRPPASMSTGEANREMHRRCLSDCGRSFGATARLKGALTRCPAPSSIARGRGRRRGRGSLPGHALRHGLAGR